MHSSSAGIFEALTQLLTHFGYPALLMLLLLGVLGLPIPDEPLMTFCGYLVYSGRLMFVPAFAAAVCGSMGGISLSYFIGRRFARAAVTRFGRYIFLTPAKLSWTEALFQRHGPILLTVGYFIPGLRHFTAIIAGLTGLSFRRFAIFAYLGAVLWVAVFLTLGYVVGNSWEHTSVLVHRYTLILSAAALLTGFVFWIFRRRSRT